MMTRIINRLWFFEVLTIITVLIDPEYCNETQCCKCRNEFFADSQENICADDSVDDSHCEEDFDRCQPCRVCDEDGNQEEESPCTHTEDRVCRCKDGFLSLAPFGRLLCLSCQDCRHSECPECKQETPKCPNGTVWDQAGNCMSCEEQDCVKPQCKDTDTCAEARPSISVIVIALILPLLVGLLLIVIRRLVHCERKHCWTSKEKNNNLPDQCHEDTNKIIQISKQGDHLDQLTIVIPQELKITAPSTPGLEPPVQPSEDSRLDPYTQSLIKNEHRGNYSSPVLLSRQHAFSKYEAQVLYTIIREVPVRRWKEFLRLLSVSDEEIERVEMETGTSYLERQYQMLRLWSQGSNSNLEILYSTLHTMDLSGCADKLEDKLQRILHTTPQPSQ